MLISHQKPWRPEGSRIIYLKRRTEKYTFPTRILYVARIFFNSERETKTFPDKQKLRELVANRPALQEMPKIILQAKIK